MLTYFPYNILFHLRLPIYRRFANQKNNLKNYVHMYIFMYICTYHVHLISTLMSGKDKYEKDKSNGNLLWPLCPEKCWIFRTVLIGEMCHIGAPTVHLHVHRLPYVMKLFLLWQILLPCQDLINICIIMVNQSKNEDTSTLHLCAQLYSKLDWMADVSVVLQQEDMVALPYLATISACWD